MLTGSASKLHLGALANVVDADRAHLHRWRPGIRHRYIPGRRPGALGGRAARDRNRVGSRRCTTSERVAAEDRDSGRVGSCLAGLFTLVRTAGRKPRSQKHRKNGEELVNANSATLTIPSAQRRMSLTAGILYLLTFVSIPTLALYGPVKGAHYVIGSGPDTGAVFGGVLEIIVALAGIGTAVVLFPILKKQNEGFALGLVASRTLEAATIFLGVGFLLTVVTLRKDGVGPDALVTTHTLVVLYNRIFLLGQSFMPAVNDLLLGTLLYQSQLVPRRLSRIGIVGGPVLVAGYLAVLFGLIDQHGPIAGLSALPVAVFEFSLGVWLVVKGFNPEAVARARESVLIGLSGHRSSNPSDAGNGIRGDRRAGERCPRRRALTRRLRS